MNPEFNPDTISIIIGLGNPGKEYENTFHNVGQIVLKSSIIGDSELKSPKPSFSYVKLGHYTIIFPKTFMNESGIAAADSLSYFKADHTNLLVVHDDADLPIGEAKLQFARGSAGHNGIKSIMEKLGTEEFWRFRIGIRNQENDEYRLKAKAFVLNAITEDEMKKIKEIEKDLAEKLEIKNPLH